MVLLGKEQPIGLETQEVFNPTTVNMVLQAQQNYVNAMREDYIRQQEEMKQFRKEYGDFYSPISKDNQLWYAATQQPIKELMEKYGPNLMRSQEGRAMIANTLNNVDYGLLSRLKASAANALQYQKVLMELKAKGEYSDEYQHWLNKQRGVSDFENWDTANDGVFAASSPDIYKDLNSVTHSWYDNAERLYKGMEGGNRVYALDMNDLKNIAQTNAQGFVKTPRGAYEMYQIKNQLKQAYPQLSEDQLNTKAGELLNERVAQANIEQLKAKKYEADEFSLASYRNKLDIDKYWSTTGRREKEQDQKYNIFYDARMNGRTSISYTPSMSSDLRIAAMPGRGIRTIYDDNNTVSYTMSGKSLKRSVYHGNTVNSKGTPKPITGSFKDNKDYIFIPDGQFKAREGKNKEIRYFIQGRIGVKQKVLDGNGNPVLDKNGKQTYKTTMLKSGGRTADVYMEVQENPHAYKRNNTIE